MRAIRGAATALLATAALCLAAPTAGAADEDPWGDGTGDVAGDGAGPWGEAAGNATGSGPGSGPGSGDVTGEGTGHDITSFGFSVSPSTVAPGGTVTLKSDGCEVPSVTVTSGVFDSVTLNEGRAGTAKVDADAKVGAEYQVTFDCKGEKGTTPLTIAGGTTGGHETGGHETGGHETGGRESVGTDTGAHKGVKAGFGGGADAMGTPEVVTGTALIAGALGAGGLLLLRRRRADDRA